MVMFMVDVGVDKENGIGGILFLVYLGGSGQLLTPRGSESPRCVTSEARFPIVHDSLLSPSGAESPPGICRRSISCSLLVE